MSNNHFKIDKGITYTGQASAPASPTEGDQYFNNVDGKFKFREGGVWKELGGSGSGNPSEPDLLDLRYLFQMVDDLSDTQDASSPIDFAAGKTDVSLYSSVYKYYRLAYDATRLLTGTGTSMAFNTAPDFTIKAGDVVTFGTETRRIQSISSQTVFTLDFAFTANPSGSACCVSQAVHTVDLNNYTANSTGQAASALYTSNISKVLISYKDSETIGDIIADFGSVARISYSVSADGSNWSANRTRPDNQLNTANASTSVPVAGTNFYVRFFANKTTGSGAVNLLSLEAYWAEQYGEQAGVSLKQAFARPTSGIYQNCTYGVVSGKSRLKFNFSYPVGVNLISGIQEAAGGSLDVFANGQKLPRFVSGVTDAAQAYYKEIDESTIEFDTDYTAAGIEFSAKINANYIDSNSNNTTRLSTLEAYHQEINDLDRVVIPLTTQAVTSIVNRGLIPDLTNDLYTSFGSNRLEGFDIYLLPEESGPNGENVYGLVGDKFNQVRFVGQWAKVIDVNGIYIGCTAAITNYIEYTFFGTGVNILGIYNTASKNQVVSIDGAAEGANIVPASTTNPLASRQYRALQAINIASGLTLGRHTVKIRNNTASEIIAFEGFDVIGHATQLATNPGSYYAKGAKYSLPLQSVTSYNTDFESGVLGTKGGRVVRYLYPSGVIAKALTPTDTTTLTLTSTNHTNEEVLRKYNFREFGSGRSDDFSTLTAAVGASSRVFTLEDGCTTLTSNGRADQQGGECLALDNATTNHMTLQFVGTGLDIVVKNDATLRTATLFIDGTSSGTISHTGTSLTPLNVVKLCSGLPYGQHSVRIQGVATPTTFGVTDFIVYGPKKPTVPATAVELDEYFLTGDFVTPSSASEGFVPGGAIRNACGRGVLYSGTINAISVNVNNDCGLEIITSASGTYADYEFFGTGISLKLLYNLSAAVGNTISIDGNTNLSGFTTALVQTGSGLTFTPSTGVINGTSSGSQRVRLTITGLTPGRHKVRVLNTVGSNNTYFDCMDVITPVHFPKMNNVFDAQSTLSVGATSIGDSRKLKDQNTRRVKVYQATGLQNDPATSSSTLNMCPDLSVVVQSDGEWFKADWALSAQFSGGQSNTFQVFVDGVGINAVLAYNGTTGPSPALLTGHDTFYLSKGTHKVDLYWAASGGTMTATSMRRRLDVISIGK